MLDKLTGSIVALVTPMHTCGKIDYGKLNELIELHIASGTSAITVAGTTGECSTLSSSEHNTIVETVIGTADGRIPIIVGTGSNCTKTAISMTEHAKSAGADACLLVTPYFNKPTQQGLFNHYQLIADSVDIPQILYSVPHRTAVSLSIPTLLKLAKHRNIIGLKDAGGNVSFTKELIARKPADFNIWSGNDEDTVKMIAMGASGGISVIANVLPKMVADIYQLALSSKMEQAFSLDTLLQPLYEQLFVETSPIPVKWLMNELNLISGGLRLPLTQLTNKHCKKLITSYNHAINF